MSTDLPDYIEFKVKVTAIGGGVTHLSPTASINIATIFISTQKDVTVEEAKVKADIAKGAYFPKENVVNLLAQGIVNEKDDPRVKEHDVKAYYGGEALVATVITAVVGAVGISLYRVMGSSSSAGVDEAIIRRMRSSSNKQNYDSVGDQSVNMET